MKLILFGSPGSGKGTQAVMLGEYLGVKRISLGDILREEVKKNTSLGKEVKQYMEKGLLVPDELVSRVIEEHVDDSGFVLDGYPRNLPQAKRLEQILAKKKSDIDICIYLDIDEQTIINRLSKRRICKNCGFNYHLQTMPPKVADRCDHCQGELIQRRDDTLEVIKKRWQVFFEENRRILDFYRKKGKLVTVDGHGNKEAVFEKIKATLS